LYLGEQAPLSSTPARFSTTPVAPGGRLRIFGYPGTPPRANGHWVDLDLKGEVGRQLIQVESRGDQSIKAQPGFSGSPVWSHQTGDVVGLLHATAFADERERDAYLIPGHVIAQAWEEELHYLLVPNNPYRGLEPFTQDYAEVFFGRDADITQLVEMVRSKPLTILIGPSGVGKSSVALAGVVPALIRERPWSVASVRPGPDPWQRLAASLFHAQRGNASPLTYDDSRREIDRLRAEGIDPIAQFLRSEGRPLIIVIDQFEELLDAEQPDHRDLIDLLIGNLDKGLADPTEAPARILLTLRADFFDSLLLIPGMSSRVSSALYPLSPLTDDQLREAIMRPAATQGVGFEDGLLDVLSRESADGSMLPLIQFTLTQLWPEMQQKLLTHARYHSIGGVTGALDRFADQQAAALAGDPSELLDRVLLRLVRAVPDAGRGRTLIMRRRAYKRELLSEEWEVLQHLADARLVITDKDASDSPYAELVHEALITAWQRMNGLVNGNVELLNWVTDMERRATEGDLLPRSRLPSALTWLAERPGDIPESVKTFVAKSEAAEEEVDRKARQLEALAEVGQAVGSSLVLDEVLSTIVTNAVRMSGADEGLMMQYDEEDRCFSVRSAFGVSSELLAKLGGIHIGLDAMLLGEAALEGHPVAMPDLSLVPLDPHLQLLIDDGWRSVLVVPVLRADQIIGELVVGRRRHGDFPNDTPQFLETFASQAALAVVNAGVFQELELRSAELQVVSQFKSDFVASMSHELRTPLNAVIGFSEVLLERMFGDLNERQEEYLRDILDSGRHLLELLNEILDFSKVEAGRMELELSILSVRDALEYCISLVRERASLNGIALTLDLDPRLDVIESDELRFRQVVLNLLSNAVKFTPDGGHVAVAARQRGRAVEVTITDDGIGIPAEDRERIFESFQQGERDSARHEGTGLGLTLSRRIVTLLGGTLWLESEVGVGSTFGFVLPMRQVAE
jgi:signal transduction histidine kinase